MVATADTTVRQEINLEIFDRYAGLSLPRHVSYPMPTWWSDVDQGSAAQMHGQSAQGKPGYDLSLYVHIPFCEKLCRFCACTREILGKNTGDTSDRVERYVAALECEIRSVAVLVDASRPLRQVHWGGGTPTYLSSAQIERIQSVIASVFRLADDAEIAMEVDPRGVLGTADGPSANLATLRRLGFNRISLGVQDFDQRTQEHVHRIQPFEMVREVVATCRELEFESVNFDLIYGMPYQTPETIRDTVEKTISLSPDRIAFYHYAQIPEKIATQRGMDYTQLPDSRTKLKMFLVACDLFPAGGYQFVGLDHFARRDEALVQSLEDGTLQRNFQGMTTGGDLRLIGVGASAISHLIDVGFLQNVKDTDQYIACVAGGRQAVERGKRLSRDDRIRQAVISQLYCYCAISPKRIERRFGIEFSTYFDRELTIIEELERNGLVCIDGSANIHLTSPLGHILMRNVAAVFDAYLDRKAYCEGQGVCFSANA